MKPGAVVFAYAMGAVIYKTPARKLIAEGVRH